jgi:Asp/Glu/hydantoin racemase
MIRRLALIHTVVFLTELFKDLLREHLPNLDHFHVVDESLLQDLLREGQITPSIRGRIAAHVWLARCAGADFVLFTCSSTSPAVDSVRGLVDIPVMKIDDPMARRAVETGKRIGVVVTAPTTLRATVELIHSHAKKEGKEVVVNARLEEKAFQALMAGDREGHDRMVTEVAQELALQSDVIVLAQASMSHLASSLHERLSIPVLSSPRLCIEALVEAASK